MNPPYLLSFVHHTRVIIVYGPEIVYRDPATYVTGTEEDERNISEQKI